MTSDPRAALSALVAALETHLELSAVRRGENDPAVVTAYQRIADAFVAYDDALLDAYGEVTPLDIYTDDEDEDDLDEELDEEGLDQEDRTATDDGDDDDSDDDNSDDDDSDDDDSDDDDADDEELDDDDDEDGGSGTYVGLDDEEYDLEVDGDAPRG